MQQQGIVMTSGCFDLLRVGHVRHLQEARQLGSYLIVAIDSDHRVRELKGSNRPVFPQDARTQMLAALSCVDQVHVFRDENHLLQMIAATAPRVYVKGLDYRNKTIFGACLVRTLGGRVVTCGPEKFESTTEVIREIVDRYGSL